MWRRWQLPCIALSLNNGMLICITRDVITSTVKRKHNNSSSAPPWDRLGWPTLALWRDALELWLSQTHTRTHTRAHTHTHLYMQTRTHSHSRKLFWSAAFIFAHAVQLISCWPLLLKHTHSAVCTKVHSDTPQMHSLTCNVSSWIKLIISFSISVHFFSSPFCFFFVFCFARAWQECVQLYICILSCDSQLPLWRWTADRVETAVPGSSTVNTMLFVGRNKMYFSVWR